MLACHHSPQKVLHHGGILILPTKVVGMMVYRLLAEPVVYKKMVQHANDSIGALTHVDSFIDQVVDLSGNGLTYRTHMLLGAYRI